MDEVNRLFSLGVRLGINFKAMPNHTKKFLVSKVSKTGPVLKPIPILPTKKQILKDFAVQNAICLDDEEIIPVHEEKQHSQPLLGLENTFLSDEDTELSCCFGSCMSDFPPGFEPEVVESSVDDCSTNPESVNESQQAIPLKLRNELKRLGISVEVFASPPSRPRRSVTSRGKFLTQ